ncbi:hypothetical protein CPC08DRAFT_824528 [Agrocybe pediades]|nr:hypothetical protein CPC08DRAFT_824528 [Agrocybe pediades]
MSAKNSNKREIVIIVIGLTGAGKSFFVNKATGGKNAEAVSDSQTSSAAPLKMITLPQRVDGNLVQIIDTRGFDDTNSKIFDAATWSNMTRQLTDIRTENPKRLFGAIYLTSFRSDRVQEADKKNLETFLLLYGTNVPRKVVLASNRGTQGKHDELVRLAPWNTITNNGSHDAHFSGGQESALAIVEKVVQIIMADQRGFEFNEKSIAKKLEELGSLEQKEYKKRQSGLQKFFSMLRFWK